MAQEILLKSGERVNRFDHMEQMKNIEEMKAKAAKKEPVKIEGDGPISEKLTVPQLKAIAAERGLEVEGLKKAELLDLLLESEDQDETGL